MSVPDRPMHPTTPGAPPPDTAADSLSQWPAADPALAAVERLLTEHRPTATPIDPGFARSLGARFARAAARRSREGAAPTSGLAMPKGLRRGVARLTSPPWLTAWRDRRGPVVPRILIGASLATAALASVVLVAHVRGAPTLPPAVDRAALVARNARAWADVQGLTGKFGTGDGWYFEEWISRQDDGGLRFKRFIRPPERTLTRPQWNVSDGTMEWVVDAATRQVRFSRPAVPGDITLVAPNDAMQCTALALPPAIGDGPAPWPVLIGNRPAYRLDGALPDGAPAVFWLDAGDDLVFRIDRPGIGTVWKRLDLDVNPRLPERLFRPESLANM